MPGQNCSFSCLNQVMKKSFGTSKKELASDLDLSSLDSAISETSERERVMLSEMIAFYTCVFSAVVQAVYIGYAEINRETKSGDDSENNDSIEENFLLIGTLMIVLRFALLFLTTFQRQFIKYLIFWSCVLNLALDFAMMDQKYDLA